MTQESKTIIYVAYSRNTQYNTLFYISISTSYDLGINIHRNDGLLTWKLKT